MSSLLQRLLHNLNLHSLLPSHCHSMAVGVGSGWCMTVLSPEVGSGWCMTVLSPEVTFHIQQRMGYYCNPTHVTPTLGLSTLTSTMTLTLDFQSQILKKSYLRKGMADWHGREEMWVDKMLDPCCDFQLSPHPCPSPWIFKVKFWKSRLSRMGWPIDMERKRCELIKCWTQCCDFQCLPHPWPWH